MTCIYIFEPNYKIRMFQITELEPFIKDQTYQTLKYLYADYNKISNLLPLEASPFIANYLVLSLKFNKVKQVRNLH